MTELPDPTSAAARFLIDRGVQGYVWLDPDLVVVGKDGSLVDFVEIGQRVGHAVVQLFGLDDEIQALREQPERSIELNDIAIAGPDQDGPRLNFHLYWMTVHRTFLLIVARTRSQADVEAEVETQARRVAMAEADAAAKTREVEKINAELNEVAYVISHDLRSPMRGIRYQAEDLEQALAAGDTAAAIEEIEGLKRQTRRMSRMLTDLLAYARIGRTPQAMEATDTRAMIGAIVDSLPRPSGLEVEIGGDWPVLDTVPAALDLVLRNLIDNAIKHHDKPAGRIAITAGPVPTGARADRQGSAGQPGGLAIEVADDGPGIAPQHQHAVFLPFRKLSLDETSDAAGSGIGLALVRKTVEAMGATIELVSDPDVRPGTVFKLVWPGRIVAI